MCAGLETRTTAALESGATKRDSRIISNDPRFSASDNTGPAWARNWFNIYEEGLLIA
jgi:hypothetical protein